MKRIYAIVLTALLVLSLTACGGSNSAASDMAKPESNRDFGYATDSSTSGWVEAPKEEMTTEDSASASTNTSLANTKMIYRGELYLQTKSFDDASRAIDKMVKEMGGYYESHNLNQGGSYRSLHATVRVPQEKFAAFMDQAGQVAHVTDRYAYQEDVSEQYYDVESRLTTQRTKLERLQKLLAQAENMEDIITLETAISDTELTIEHLTGSLRKYDSLVNFSTITMTLEEVYRLSSEEVPVQTFGDRLSSAFARGLERGIDNLEDFVISIARNWVTLVILTAIAVPVALVIRRKWRRAHPKYVPDQSGSDDTAQS